MLSVAREVRIRALLAEGELSQRSIARMMHVSRAVISAIAAGTRQVSFHSGEDTAAFFSCSERPQRCPGCGGLVYLPCHLCRVRNYVAVREKERSPCDRRTRRVGSRFQSTATGIEERSLDSCAALHGKSQLDAAPNLSSIDSPSRCAPASKSLTNS
jgi:transcriptional regulator with XRE-family HTH domain